MIEVAIGNYFYPLITGQLVLVFNEIEINATNVREMAKGVCEQAIWTRSTFSSTSSRKFIAQNRPYNLELKSSWLDDRKLDEDDFDEQTLAKMRDRFAKGELVGLYLPVDVKPKDADDIPTGFFGLYQTTRRIVAGN